MRSAYKDDLVVQAGSPSLVPPPRTGAPASRPAGRRPGRANHRLALHPADDQAGPGSRAARCFGLSHSPADRIPPACSAGLHPTCCGHPARSGRSTPASKTVRTSRPTRTPGSELRRTHPWRDVYPFPRLRDRSCPAAARRPPVRIEHVHMVRHDAPLEQPVARAIEQEQRIRTERHAADDTSQAALRRIAGLEAGAPVRGGAPLYGGGYGVVPAPRRAWRVPFEMSQRAVTTGDGIRRRRSAAAPVVRSMGQR